VEVPFTEWEGEFDRCPQGDGQVGADARLPARKSARQVLEARIDKEAMLDQVVGEAVPSKYSEAVTTADVRPLGQPDIEITKKVYGEDLEFTAEVDVRPEIELPDLVG